MFGCSWHLVVRSNHVQLQWIREGYRSEDTEVGLYISCVYFYSIQGLFVIHCMALHTYNLPTQATILIAVAYRIKNNLVCTSPTDKARASSALLDLRHPD
jgi:hypothetical protein